jgi:uncharacterized protein YjfI (DUF2170 family)
MNNIIIESKKKNDLVEFLQLADFQVDDLGNHLYQVSRHDEIPVFISVMDSSIFFEVDLGNITEIADKDLYFKILDMNTEILPVSFGINNTNAEDPRLVIVESRSTHYLSDQELLGVFDSLEIAVDRAEALLSKKLS